MRAVRSWFFLVLLLALAAADSVAATWQRRAPTGAAAASSPSMPAHETFELDSAVLHEGRVINVYLPPGYEKSGQRYPLLVMPDGGEAEDFPHVATAIDSAIRAGEMQAVVLVGIENTERRRDMTGPTAIEADKKIAVHVGGSAAFRRFLREELLPGMRERYRLSNRSGIVGESLAGLFVVETLLLEPGLFDRYIAFSPSLWWNGGALARDAAVTLKQRKTPGWLFLAVGGDDDRDDRIAAFAATLQQSAPTSLDWRFEPHAELRHDTIYLGLEAKALRAAFPPLPR